MFAFPGMFELFQNRQENKMKIYVDIDDTICTYNKPNDKLKNAIPNYKHIKKINELYNNGHYIKYWTARRQPMAYEITKQQLDNWECLYHELSVGSKPLYDLLLICDRTINLHCDECNARLQDLSCLP